VAPRASVPEFASTDATPENTVNTLAILVAVSFFIPRLRRRIYHFRDRAKPLAINKLQKPK
jgi:hypothetical protein